MVLLQLVKQLLKRGLHAVRLRVRACACGRVGVHVWACECVSVCGQYDRELISLRENIFTLGLMLCYYYYSTHRSFTQLFQLLQLSTVWLALPCHRHCLDQRADLHSLLS